MMTPTDPESRPDAAAPDRVLLARWRDGDHAAARRLIDRYTPRLIRFFTGKTGEGVDELVQETLAACVGAYAKVVDDGDRNRFGAFVFTVARRKLLNHYRHWRRHGARFDPMTHSVVDLGARASTALARQQRRGRLHEALRQLPLDAQIALELHYWEGLRVAEIAAVVDAPVGTVKARLARARKQLRARLDVDEELGDPPARRSPPTPSDPERRR